MWRNQHIHDSVKWLKIKDTEAARGTCQERKLRKSQRGLKFVANNSIMYLATYATQVPGLTALAYLTSHKVGDSFLHYL